MIKIQAQAVLTDIEGTTTDIGFVHDVLFPYARQALPDFLRANANRPEVREQLQATSELAQLKQADLELQIQTLIGWIDEDRKATPLKALQGMIWSQGYEDAAFSGHVYTDAYENLKQWHTQGIRLNVYSSGSIAAQQLLYGHSNHGDMRALFEHWFDTTTGPKKEPRSYQAIITALQLSGPQILFLSDVLEELDAASSAGMQTLQLCRSDNMITGAHPCAQSFNEIALQA